MELFRPCRYADQHNCMSTIKSCNGGSEFLDIVMPTEQKRTSCIVQSFVISGVISTVRFYKGRWIIAKYTVCHRLIRSFLHHRKYCVAEIDFDTARCGCNVHQEKVELLELWQLGLFDIYTSTDSPLKAVQAQLLAYHFRVQQFNVRHYTLNVEKFAAPSVANMLLFLEPPKSSKTIAYLISDSLSSCSNRRPMVLPISMMMSQNIYEEFAEQYHKHTWLLQLLF